MNTLQCVVVLLGLVSSQVGEKDDCFASPALVESIDYEDGTRVMKELFLSDFDGCGFHREFSRRQTTFRTDGKRLSHLSFRKDGSLAENGLRQADGTYKVEKHDGKRVVSFSILDKDGRLIQVTTFNEAGGISRTTDYKHSPMIAVETTQFDANGHLRWKRIRKDDEYRKGYLTQVFHTPDAPFEPGTDRLEFTCWVDDNRNNVSVYQYDREQVPVLHWEIREEGMRVFTYSPNCFSPAFVQEYARTDDRSNSFVRGFELARIEERDHDGTRVIEFDADADLPSRLVMRYFPETTITQFLDSRGRVTSQSVKTVTREWIGDPGHALIREEMKEKEFRKAIAKDRPIDLSRAKYVPIPLADVFNLPELKVQQKSTARDGKSQW